MMKYDVPSYRFGWVKGMKDIQDGKVSECHVKECHTEDYAAGYCDAVRHFNGIGDTHFAYGLGLVESYKDFYGQSSFTHPES